MRAWVVTLAVLMAACSPPAGNHANTETPATNGSPQVEAPNPERDAMVAALVPAASAEIGQPVTFSVSVMRVQNEWGWLIAQPWTPDGAALDWSTTHYAERARDGVLDGNGTTYALLKKQNGAWTLTAFAVGPTDVAWANWSQRYGAPASLFDTPAQ